MLICLLLGDQDATSAFPARAGCGLGWVLKSDEIVFFSLMCSVCRVIKLPCLVFSIESEDGSRSDEACSQVFVNQLSALPCQNSTSLSSLFLSNQCKHHSRHRFHSNFCFILTLMPICRIECICSKWERGCQSHKQVLAAVPVFSLNADLSWNKHSKVSIRVFCRKVLARHPWRDIRPHLTLSPDLPARGALAQNQYLSRLVNLLARARPSKWSPELNLDRQG